MSDSAATAAGCELIEQRISRLPALLRALAQTAEEPLPIDPHAVRCFVTTGVGSSEAHARYLVHLIACEFGLPARFVPLSALAAGPTPGCARDVLIVFSQGLSPNARLALAYPDAWHRVLLATAVTPEGARRPGNEAKGALLDRLQRARGCIYRFPEEDEGTTLVRVIGPMLG